MKYLLLLLISLVACVADSIAQKQIKIKGVVKTDEGKSLGGASVFLYYSGSKDTLKTLSNDKGVFIFSGISPAKIGILTSYIGFKKFIGQYDFSEQNGDQTIWDIVMSQGDNLLETVTLESAKIQIKEDTVSYKIDSTMYRANDNVETLLKKLPGIEVDKDGTVTAQGQQVTKVKVNGKEFFGGDVLTATRELNADMVDRIQIIDDYGDQAALTGIRDGEASKTLNINLKKDKNKGYFGNVSAGAGTSNRYTGALSVNRFNDTRQISVLANVNNINASTFNFGSFSGGGVMGDVMGDMARGMGMGRGGAGAAASLGNFANSDGIGTNQSIGINFRDNWSPKILGYGSYSFSRKNTLTTRNTTQQNFFENNSTINVHNSVNDNLTNNHRFSFNLEYKMDSFNYFKFTPSVSVRKTDVNYYSAFLISGNTGNKNNEGNTGNSNATESPNFNGNLLYNHLFKKRGRSLSLNLASGMSSSNSADDFENLSTIYFPSGSTKDTSLYQYISQQNNNRNTTIRGSYAEPLNRKQSIELNYTYNRQFTGNDRENFTVDPLSGNKNYVDSLSNIFNNVYISNRFGLNFRTNEKKYNYAVGLAVQPATIQTNSVTGKYKYSQQIINYYPVVRFAYNFSRSRSFSINYNGSTSQPSYTQLQPVYDYSNPQYITVGNPNLRPEFSNNLSLRYNNFDFITGDVFFGNLSASFTNDKIVNNTTLIGPGLQQTKYLNSDGFYTLTGFYNISKPFKNRKYVFNAGGNIIYNNNISFFGNEKNRGKNWVFGQRLSMDYKIKKWLETSAAINYSLNSSSNSLQKELSSTTNAWTLSHSSRIFFPKKWILNYDMDKTINNGFAENVNTNPFIVNAGLEKQLFKKKNVSVKLQALDVLNQQTNINRSVFANSITDTRTNRLGRYYMATVVWKLNKFSGKAPQHNRIMTEVPPPPGHGF